MKEFELAWAAGFFDGEGSSGYYHQNQRISACVVQKDRRPLDRFLAAVGFGKIYMPGANPNHCYRWQVTSTRGVKQLYDILKPFLSTPKIEQFESTLQQHRDRPNQWNRDEITKQKVGTSH